MEEKKNLKQKLQELKMGTSEQAGEWIYDWKVYKKR